MAGSMMSRAIVLLPPRPVRAPPRPTHTITRSPGESVGRSIVSGEVAGGEVGMIGVPIGASAGGKVGGDSVEADGGAGSAAVVTGGPADSGATGGATSTRGTDGILVGEGASS